MGVGRVGEGGGQKKKGAKGGGEEARVRINLLASLAPLIFFFLVVRTEKGVSFSIIGVSGARCNMSQHKAPLTDARALRRARQRAT